MPVPSSHPSANTHTFPEPDPSLTGKPCTCERQIWAAAVWRRSPDAHVYTYSKTTENLYTDKYGQSEHLHTYTLWNFAFQHPVIQEEHRIKNIIPDFLFYMICDGGPSDGQITVNFSSSLKTRRLLLDIRLRSKEHLHTGEKKGPLS